MSLANAGSFLVLASLRNRVKRQVLRLKQPKYLIATLFGAFYVWSVFLRRWQGESTALVGSSDAAQAGLLIMALLSIGGSWIFGGEEGAMIFTEAEATMLFSAPVTRAALVRYKLVRTLLISVLSAAVMTLFVGRRIGSSPLLFWLGTWLGLSTLALHLTAASLTRATLVRYGLSGLRRRLVTVGAMSFALVVLVRWAAVGVKPLPPDTPSLTELARYASELMASPPLTWLLAPLRAPLQVAFAADLSQLWPALPLALGVLGLHIGWVMSSDVAFEEASLAAAEKRSARMKKVGGRRGILTVRRSAPPFVLAGTGRPEVAILWKNLTAITRVVSLRLLIVVFTVAMVLLSFLLSSGDRPAMFALGLLFCAGLGLMFGPQLVNADLRDDLPHLEILRTWPMSGRQVVTGEILAPTFLLSAVVCALLVGATVLGLYTDAGGLPAGLKVGAGLAGVLMAPPLLAAGLVAQNAAAVIFPSWVGGDNNRGVEALGQRLLGLVGRILVLCVGFFPAALVGGAVGALLFGVLGVAAIPVGAAVTSGVLVVELWFTLGMLGRAFERMDLSRE